MCVHIHVHVFNKIVFCLGEKQCMLVNDECSSWYNRVGNFLLSASDRRKEVLYGDGSACETSQINPTQFKFFYSIVCSSILASFLLSIIHQ